MTDFEQARRDFEEWARSEGFNAALAKTPEGHYKELAMNVALSAYQAATTRAVEAVEPLSQDEKDKFVGLMCEYGTEFVAPLYTMLDNLEKRLSASTPAPDFVMAKANTLADAIHDLRLYETRWLFLHTNNVDSEGYEWGIYRVKWVDGRAVSVLQTLSNFVDLDEAIAAAPNATGSGEG